MNNEIKEILDSLKKYDFAKDIPEEIKNKLNQLFKWCEEVEIAYHKDITNLQEENERLTNELNTCMIERNNFLSRIEKAVEYIKKYRAMYFPSGCGDAIEYVPLEFKRDYYENGSTFTETENLLNILNGKE